MIDAAFEQRVRERAYEIWIMSGHENGSADLHWLSAEKAMLNEAAQPCAETIVPKATAKGAVKSAVKSAKPRAAKPTAVRAATVRKRAKSTADAHA